MLFNIKVFLTRLSFPGLVLAVFLFSACIVLAQERAAPPENQPEVIASGELFPGSPAAGGILTVRVEYPEQGENGTAPRQQVIIRCALAEGTYTYAGSPENAMPTRLELRDAAGAPVPAAITYPDGAWMADLFEPGKRILAYTGTFSITVQPENMPRSPITAQLSLLACSSSNCTPLQVEIPLQFPANTPDASTEATRGTTPDTRTKNALSGQHTTDPAGSKPAVTTVPTEAPIPDVPVVPTVPIVPLSPASPLAPTAPVVQTAPLVRTVPLPPAESFPPLPLPNRQDMPPAPDFAAIHFDPVPVQDIPEPTALPTALLFGFLAGLILNVMPCVWPVLMLKLTSLLSAASRTGKAEPSPTAAGQTEPARTAPASPVHNAPKPAPVGPASPVASFRTHCLLFSLGILVWFLALALCIGGFGQAWGSLFQNPHFIFGLLLFVFLLALSLFGVFTLPIVDFKFGVSAHPGAQAFLAGLTVTLLATPCSGPLLGGVLAWAVLQPPTVLAAVFLAAGLGMAAPWLLLAAFPNVARHLPRPGSWTGAVEKIVGFFLLGTAVYLFSILPQSLHIRALVCLLAAAVAAWLWGQRLLLSSRRRALTSLLALALLCAGIGWTLAPQPAPVRWLPFASFSGLWQKEPILLEFTADWCPTCKVLERTVLTPGRLNALTERHGLRLVRADLTRPNPEAEALLHALGSISIPFAALFPAGEGAARPIVLRDLYTGEGLERAAELLRQKGVDGSAAELHKRQRATGRDTPGSANPGRHAANTP